MLQRSLKALKLLAETLLGFSRKQIEEAQTVGELIEVENDGNDAEKG
jgi:hypothetical protein